jgi:hypothetical protein
MRKIPEQTVGHVVETSSWTSRVVGLKTVLGGILFLGLLHNPGEAFSATSSVTLAWNRSTSTNVTGYRVYYGASSRNYTNSAVAGNVTTNTVPGLASGVTYFFAVTAYNASGLESTFSNEISSVTGLPTIPISVTTIRRGVLTVRGLAGQRHSILVTQNFTNWTVIGTVTLGASGSMTFTDPNAASFSRRFYRTQQNP